MLASDFSFLGSLVSLRSFARLGSVTSLPDHSCSGSSLSSQQHARTGLLAPLAGSLCPDLSSFAFDSGLVGSLVLLQSFARLGFVMLVFDLTAMGSSPLLRSLV